MAVLGVRPGKLGRASALTLLVAGTLLVDHVDATPAPDDLIVRANFFD